MNYTTVNSSVSDAFLLCDSLIEFYVLVNVQFRSAVRIAQLDKGFAHLSSHYNDNHGSETKANAAMAMAANPGFLRSMRTA
jgi:hypothetical protein